MEEKDRKKNDTYNEYADLLLQAEEEYEKNRLSPEYYRLVTAANEKYKEYTNLFIDCL
jgi:hypothetical protein